MGVKYRNFNFISKKRDNEYRNLKVFILHGTVDKVTKGLFRKQVETLDVYCRHDSWKFESIESCNFVPKEVEGLIKQWEHEHIELSTVGGHIIINDNSKDAICRYV